MSDSISTPIEGNLIHKKLTELDALIKAAHPLMPVLLREIHTHLKNDPECVTVLSEDEIGIIVSGLKRQMNTEIITEKAKTPGKKKVILTEDMF